MNPEHIKKIAELWSQVTEKKKLDPVGKADADIDNDGDVDKSDEYLHNRRKAIKKAMKNESEDEMKPCPKCDGSMQNHDPDCPMADNGDDMENESSCGKKMKEEVDINENKNLLKDYEKYMSQGGKKDFNAIDYLMSTSQYKRYTRDQMAKIIGDGLRSGKITRKAPFKLYKEQKESFDYAGFAVFLEALTAKKSSQKGGAGPEGIMDKESPISKKMAKDLDADSPEVDDTEEKGHDDASKAARAVKTQAKARNGDQLNVGDKKPVGGK